jgi:peptidoglycan/xylan/chitin deacetylase (PgdA/CDA1 family)
MLRILKRASFWALRTSGVSAVIARSSWRQKRLLILCYHLVSVKDEHEWRPTLYMTRETLSQRFQLIKDSGTIVLPLGEALQRLYAGNLPAKSLAITFDDGGYDFYHSAYPVLQEFGFSATVYQTTYYSDLKKPVFNLACSYMLWQRRTMVLPELPRIGIMRPVDLSSQSSRQGVVSALISEAKTKGLGGAAKDEVAHQLASALGIDYEQFCQSRIVQLMTPAEIAELSAQGVDFQLHTHRHRTPNDETLFRKEIRDNRKRLQEITGHVATHFCYPSGVYRMEFLPWLKAENVVSATTCEASPASQASDALLLPRLVDTHSKSAVEFETWLDGAGSFLARRPASESINHQRG